MFQKTQNEDTTKEDDIDKNYELRKLFKTRRTPLTSHFLEEFEDRIWNLINKIEFKQYPNRKNAYLKDLNKKLKELKNNEGVLLLSVKTRNIYRISPCTNDKLLQKELCKKYKIIDYSFLVDVNTRAKALMDKLGL